MLHTTAYKGFFIHSTYNEFDVVHRVQFPIEQLLTEDKFMLGDYVSLHGAKMAITNELKRNPPIKEKSLDKIYMK